MKNSLEQLKAAGTISLILLLIYRDTGAASLEIKKKSYLDEEFLFRFDFNEDQMAIEKLREGTSKFAANAEALKAILKEKIEA